MTRTEQDLRAVLRALEADAPDVPDILAATYRRHRRRTTRHRIAAMAAVAVVTGAVMAGAVTVPDLVGSNERPAVAAATGWNFRFAVDDIPGAQVELVGVDALYHSASVHLGPARAVIRVYASGTFDPDGVPDGETVDVNGRKGTYFSSTPNIGVAWEYAPGSWALVHDLPPGKNGRAEVLRIARAVRFDRTTPFRVPFRIGYLPAGMRPAAAVLNEPEANGPVDVRLRAGDKELSIRASNDGGSPGTTPGVRPYSAEADLGPFEVVVQSVRLAEPLVVPPEQGLPREELVKVLQSISVAADWSDRSTWIEADKAIPVS